MSRDDACGGLRVAIVCYPTQGGSGVLAAELARELGRRNHLVHVISHSAPLRLHRNLPGVTFHEVGLPTHPLLAHAPYGMALAAKIAEVARYERIDLVHVHYAVPHAFAAVTAREMLAPLPLPVVATLHGTDVTQLGSDETIAETLTWSLSRCDAVTAVSEHLAALARRRFQLPGVRTIPNFIDPHSMRRRHDGPARAALAPHGELVLMHASNFRAVKRIPDVISIFAGVAARRPAVLALLGDGPEAAAARRLAHDLGVADRVRFLGVQEEMAPLLSAADIFLLPSDAESFGLAALEAMACEVPVVASRTGGLPEVVADGETGLLCPPGDVAGMTAACLRLAEPAAHARFAAAARRRAVGRFGAVHVVPQYEALYREMTGVAVG